MISRSLTRVTPQVTRRLTSANTRLATIQRPWGRPAIQHATTLPLRRSCFHTSSITRASTLSADEIMENLNDLYATAKDEFEIAAEGTEEKTVYAEEDREAAKEALTLLTEAFKKAVAESDPDVAKEVQKRVGQRIRELANAITAMEERAMED